MSVCRGKQSSIQPSESRNRSDMTEIVYKICGRAAWEAARSAGRYGGSPADRRDGFIHLSTAPQLPGTARKHFSGREDLVIIAIDAIRLGDDLRWEPSRGGQLFPHLYGDLDLSDVLWVQDLPLGRDGLHRIPEGIAK